MKSIIVFFIGLLMLGSTQAQTGGKKSKHNYYVVIDDSSFVNAMPDKGAVMTGYYINDSLSRIETVFTFNYGEVRRTYYYWKDTLSLILEVQKLYNATATPAVNPDSIKASYTGRYIFKHNKITDINQKGSYSISDTPTSRDETEKTFILLSNKYVALLEARRANKKNRIRMAAGQ